MRGQHDGELVNRGFMVLDRSESIFRGHHCPTGSFRLPAFLAEELKGWFFRWRIIQLERLDFKFGNMVLGTAKALTRTTAPSSRGFLHFGTFLGQRLNILNSAAGIEGTELWRTALHKGGS